MAAAIIAASRHHHDGHEHLPKTASDSPFEQSEEAMREHATSADLAEHVDLGGWYLELRVRKLQSTSLEQQRMVLTKDVIAFGPLGSSAFDDVIPLSELQRVHDLSEPGRGEGSWGVVPVGKYLQRCLPGMCAFMTVPGGFNGGRSYCISVEFPLQIAGKDGEGRPASSSVPDVGAVFETQAVMLKALEAVACEAKVRVQSQSFTAKVARSRLSIRRIFQSLPLQVTVAILLVTNFFANALEAQLAGKLTLPDGSPSDMAQLLDHLDIFFTTVFTVELLFNVSPPPVYFSPRFFT